MAQLSRRSKDNATDLISLKEATNSRDEDIRKSLKELAANITKKLLDPQLEQSSHISGAHRSPGTFLLENKAYSSPSGMPKSSSFPRVTTPSIFGESELSASTYNMEGTASIALLEKIWRDMGTKEGQDQVLAILADLKEKAKEQPAKGPDTAVLKKLEEVLNFMKEKAKEEPSYSRALVPRRDNGNRVISSATKGDSEFDPRPAPLATASRELTPKRENTKASHLKAADFINDDLQKLLKKMKDSITEGGGMTAEVKAHVRELRGEVLGMGRDIARRLEQAETRSKNSDGENPPPTRDEIAAIVEDGLGELKDQLEVLMREKRRQSSSSITSRRSIDEQEVYAAVKNALIDFPAHQGSAVQKQGSGIEREEILDAVREAWETYKPEIELQNFGLERDEILSCLKEGLQQYQPKDQNSDFGGATYDEVLDAVKEGLQNFQPPAPLESESSLTREEILICVRECLDTYDFPRPATPAPRETEMTRDDVLDAVKEGLSSQAPISKEIEFNREDLFEAVKAGIEGVATPMGGLGEKVMDKMEELIDDMRVEFKQYSVANGGDTEQVLDAMKDGLEVLRSDIESYVDRAADVTGKDEIIDTIKQSLDDLRGDFEERLAKFPSSGSHTDRDALLDAMEREFEHLRQTIATSMVRSASTSLEREDILDTIKDSLDQSGQGALRELNEKSNSATLSAIRLEFEHLRETLATTMMRNGAAADKDEVLDAVREIHDSIRAELTARNGAAVDKDEVLDAIREINDNIRAELTARNDRPESILSGTSEVLDALNDGLDGLRTDLEKLINKPLDMTVNYEILETLKDGLSSIKIDMERLHTAQSNQGGSSGMREGEVVIADENIAGTYRSSDIANLEMMITQLRIKVEALDNMPSSTEAGDGAASRQHIESLESMLKEMQSSIAESIADIAQRDKSPDESLATKEDVDALETLLRNTKAKIDDLASSDAEGIAKVNHVESLEAAVNEARDAIQDLGSDSASKKDFGVLEALLQEVRVGLEELREKGLEGVERVTRSDFEALETLCMDTKIQIDELALPDPETLPTKEEIAVLTETVRSFNDQVAEGHALSAQAFEARKTEHGGIADKIEDVKLIFEDVREELKARIDDNHNTVKDVAETLESMATSIAAADATASLDDIRQIITKEFDSARQSSDSTKDYHESNHLLLLEKHDEQKSAIITELNARLDARFDDIMTKYDDAQLAAKDKERVVESKEAEQTAALNATKTIAEDLRLLIDTLGSTMTDSCERMGEDSKTVYSRVEQLGAKLDQLIAGDGRAEHQATRAEISKTLASVEGIQAHASEYDPKILDAVHNILSIVGQHYEQAKLSSEEIKMSVEAIPGAIPLPAIAAPSPEPELLKEAPVEKYDDSDVHMKLDQLITHAADAAKAAAEMDVLEQIRDQLAGTSEKLSDFVMAQQIITNENNEQRIKEAEDAAVALEKRNAQKALVEVDIVRLSDEKQILQDEVQDLRREKQELLGLKSRVQADLSSLEMALQIRREELQIMEARADTLERRILDGILDHSRSLLTTSRPPSSLREMNLKRVTSTSSNNTAATRRTSAVTTLPSTTPSAVSSGIGMALKRRQPPKTLAVDSRSPKTDRRILSLSTLGGNKGTSTDRAMVLANPSMVGGSKVKTAAANTGPLQRSHSVKSNFPSRKSSWGGTKTIGMYADEAVDESEDKENSILDEVDEEDAEGSEATTERRTSYTGTDRRTSYSGTYTGTGSYGEGSIISSINGDKRDSYAASTVGTIGTRDFAFTEDGHSEGDLDAGCENEEEREMETSNDAEQQSKWQGLQGEKGEVNNSSEVVLYGQNSDSGIGTDIPTAQLESRASGSDYFRGD